MRIAVVTPYYREEPEVLGRCIESVRAQPMPADHILVADGFPQDWVERHGHVRHIVLRQNSADFGDTPRSVGFLVAMRRGYDLIQLLDADNVLYPGHFEAVRECAARSGADLIVARRRMLRPDGSVLEVRLDEDEQLRHVDTSCFAFRPAAFHVGLKWGFIPPQLGFYDDRIFYAVARQSGVGIAALAIPTVGYTCMWEGVYRVAGETPPPGCRDLMPHYEQALAWWTGLAPAARQLIERNLGITLNIS